MELMEYVTVPESSQSAEQAPDIDAELIERIAAGDRQALTELYLRHRVSLLHYLLQFTSDYQLAEELLQDTFVAIWQNGRSFSGRSRGRAWLLGIARRRAWKTLRRREEPLVAMAELETIAARSSDAEPEAAFLASVARDELVAALAHLIPVYRETLLLRYVHELSYQEIADVLQVPIGTVRSRLNAAKRELHAVLRGGEEARE